MKVAMFMTKYEVQTYAILRIVIGFLFLWHGSQKLFNYPPLPEGVKLPLYLVSLRKLFLFMELSGQQFFERDFSAVFFLLKFEEKSNHLIFVPFISIVNINN